MSVLFCELVGLAFGLAFGSFLNVCIFRVPRGESVVQPGSHCMECGRPVRWFDNVPVLSWLVLQGKCRDCGARFSWQYPAVELLIGLWFAVAGAKLYGCWVVSAFAGDVRRAVEPASILSAGVVAFAILGWLLIGLIVIDWQWQRLPDAFTLTGIAIGMFLVGVQAIFLGPTDDQIVLNTTHQLRMSSPGSFQARGNIFLTGPEALIFGRLAAICGAALILLLFRWAYKALRGREGLGLGDVKMLAMVAAFLGFWPAVLTLFLGVILAAFWGGVLLARGKAGGATQLPLGSFLGVAGLVAALFGGGIIEWYRGLL